MAKSEQIQQVKQRFGIVGNSIDLNRAIEIALQVAPTDLSVLITGESGVGKESFPQIIHQYSLRKHGTYIAVNCGSIPEGTIDSELFGHEKGSFTGATGTRKGYFEEADGGTLFLDEVGELPLATQARLLRVLETGEFMKVGSSKVEKTNVRVVAATNLNMVEATKKGRFREDLYYRLNSVPIRIPALRDRKEDIPLLFRKFASDAAEKYHMPSLQIDESAREALMKYRWPGNIRQLKNITEQISVIEQERDVNGEIVNKYLPKEELSIVPIGSLGGDSADSKSFANEREILYQVLFDMKKDISDLKKVISEIVSGNLPTKAYTAPVSNADAKLDLILQEMPETRLSTLDSLRSDSPLIEDVHEVREEKEDPPSNRSKVKSLQEVEREMIIDALERHGGKRKNAAQDLQISERTLYRKIKEYNLDN